MRVARQIEPVQALILLLAASTAGHMLFLLLRSPVEADDATFVAATLPLFLVPAVIAIVGLVRGSMPLVGAAGTLSMFPAIMSGWPVIAFAGFLAIAGLSRGPLPPGQELLRGIAVAILGTATWIVPYLGMDPFAPIDATRIAVGMAMVAATIALAIGRPMGRRAVGFAG